MGPLSLQVHTAAGAQTAAVAAVVPVEAGAEAACWISPSSTPPSPPRSEP